MARLVVIMAVRNSESTVGRAVRSTLRAMEGVDAEMHVLNDASTDATAEVLGAISDPRISLHSSEVQLGSGRARNVLMRATDSEWVANMDGDDVSLPWRFRSVAAQMEAVDAAFASIVKFGGSPKVRPTYPFKFAPSQSRVAALFHDPFWHPTMVARRDALEAVGGYRALPRAQDYDLWLRMIARGARLVRTPTPTVLYRMSPTQVTAEPDFLRRIRASEELWQSYSELYRQVVGSDPEPGSERTSRELAKVAASMPSRILSAYYGRIVRLSRTTLV